MKDSLFEILMNFFEKSLTQLKKSKSIAENDELNQSQESEFEVENKAMVIRPANNNAIRVFTYEEQMKFTKASYQFIMQMMLLGIIASESLEQIITQLLFSESRYITLQETKWTIRNTLAEHLDASQLAFLDLVLYQKEDDLPLH